MEHRDGKVFVKVKDDPAAKKDYYVPPLDMTLKGRKWQGDWEFRIKLRHEIPAGLKCSMVVTLIFEFGYPNKTSGFMFREANEYGRLYSELTYQKSGFPGNSGMMATSWGQSYASAVTEWSDTKQVQGGSSQTQVPAVFMNPMSGVPTLLFITTVT